MDKKLEQKVSEEKDQNKTTTKKFRISFSLKSHSSLNGEKKGNKDL